MASYLFWLVAIGPFGLVALGLTQVQWANRHPKVMLQLANSLCGISTLTSIAILLWVTFRGAIGAPLVGMQGLGFSLYLDPISSPMFALVSFIGLIVILYSRNYLAGDPGQGRFVKWIALTLGSVLFLIISGNLVQFLLSWICMSVSLHKLLLFYPERPAAILAARKKWVVSRLGDLCLVAAMILIFRTLGSLEYVSILPALKSFSDGGTTPPILRWAAAPIAFAAILKSAQFPIHGWLLEVMETPTSVSALLHAGIINAGGFLVIRFSHLVILSPVAMNSLLLIGAATALFGSVVMLTQTSVKVSLAYSTIAQMGFMMLECGLGVFSAAMLHILAHSLYKAHAFLSSGSAVELSQLKLKDSHAEATVGPIANFSVIAAALLTSLAMGILFHLSSGIVTLGCIFALGVAVLCATGFERGSSALYRTQIAIKVIGVTALFYGVQYCAEVAFSAVAVHDHSSLSEFEILIRIAIALLFGLVALMQKVLPDQDGERWLALYTHISNGFYINTIANRLAIRFWPSPAPRSSVPSYIPSIQGGRQS